MSIGERRMRVTFQRSTETQSSSGEIAQTWAKLADSWALVQPLKGREFFEVNSTQSDVTTRIVVRSQTLLEGLTPKDRVIWGTKTYDIRSVIFRDHRRKEIELMCTEHL